MTYHEHTVIGQLAIIHWEYAVHKMENVFVFIR